MTFDLLINIFDEHNEASILLTEKYKPKNILFFYTENFEKIQLEKLKRYYNEKFPSCIFEYKRLSIDNPCSIERVITSYEGMEAVCNLTSGKKLCTLMVYSFCLKHNIDCRYIDIKNEKLITLTKDGVFEKQNSFVDLDIEDIIKSVGGSIIIDSTEFYNKKVIDEITNWISNNLDKWEEVKLTLQDNTIFIRDDRNPDFMKIKKEALNSNDIKFYRDALRFLESRKQIAVKEDNEFYKIYFLNDFLKSFIFKSGTWLEVLTKKVVEDIEVIDDVKSGVLFLWNDNKAKVRNELDVVAIKDSILICISCKDSRKYDEVALNELNVYASQLGGENVIKILVATKEPLKSTISHRAKEMNINIVIYDGNLDKFKNIIEDIIKNNKKR